MRFVKKNFYYPLSNKYKIVLGAIALASSGFLYNDVYKKHNTGFLSFLFQTNHKLKRVSDVIITQNSGLFTEHTLSYLGMSEIIDLPDAQRVIFLDDFWLTSVDQSRLHTKWGQTVNEFPLPLKSLFLKLYPTLKPHQRVTFEQFLAVRGVVKEVLVSDPNIEMISNSVQSIRYNEITSMDALISSYFDHSHLFDFLSPDFNPESRLEVITQDGITHSYCCDKEKTRVINTTTMPRENKAMTLMGKEKDLPPQTDLYRYPISEEPKQLVIFGSGLSAVWVKQQAPNSEIRFILRNEQSQLPTTIARNESIHIRPDEIIYADQVDFIKTFGILYSTNNDPYTCKMKKAILWHLHKQGISPEHISEHHISIRKKDSYDVIFTGEGYNATGFIPRTIPAYDLPEGMLQNIHFSRDATKIYAPKNLPAGALFDRTSDQVHRLTNVAEKDRPLLVNLEALFFREEDLESLANYFGVSKVVISYIFEQVNALEDTPSDPKSFIQNTYQNLYSTSSNVNFPCPEAFNEKLKILFEKREAIFSKEQLPCVGFK